MDKKEQAKGILEYLLSLIDKDSNFWLSDFDDEEEDIPDEEEEEESIWVEIPVEEEEEDEEISVGYYLGIGLNRVSPAAYHGWDGKLNGCLNDLRDMSNLARVSGFNSCRMLKDSEATVSEVIGSLSDIRETIKSGDTLLVTYSGHGGQVPDNNGEELDGKDETWCLFDGQLLDDEIAQEFNQFPEGVNIIVISDSCHSGTVTRAATTDKKRRLPTKIQNKDYQESKQFYDEIRTYRRLNPLGEPQANVMLLSGCAENQYSYDGNENGAFTGALLEVWDKGHFNGNWREFHRAISKKLPAYQSPQLYMHGPTVHDLANEKVFDIG